MEIRPHTPWVRAHQSTGQRHPQATLLGILLWAIITLAAPTRALILLTATLAIVAIGFGPEGRDRMIRTCRGYWPWALVWVLTAWWGQDFRESGLIPAVRLGWATLIAVVGMDYLLGGFDLTRFTTMLSGGLAPLARLRIPVNDICLVAAMMLRFLPLLRAEWQQLRWARRAQGRRWRWWQRVKVEAEILVPLLAKGFWRADQMASILWLKGIGRMNLAVPERWHRRDLWWVLGIVGVGLVSWWGGGS